jgi:hypothetical protein
MSYQQPPDDPYRPEHRQPQFAPGPQGQPTYQQPPQPYYGQGEMRPAVQDQPGYPAAAAQPGHRNHRPAAGKQYTLRGAETFWYVLGCIGLGVAYFSKLPVKKAACEILSELQLDGQGPSRSYSLRGAETFWYVLMCIAFGGGYFAKGSAKKALWEIVGIVQSAPADYAEAISRALYGAASPGRPAY